jgi:hypothetical protein
VYDVCIEYLPDALLVQLPTGELAEEGGGVALGCRRPLARPGGGGGGSAGGGGAGRGAGGAGGSARSSARGGCGSRSLVHPRVCTAPGLV